MRMTFQAVIAAVKAVLYCFPIICLDAYFLSSYNTRGVILTATVAKTDMKLLIIGTGTA